MKTPRNVDLLPRVPVSCFWEITDACNLRCIHCENRAGRKLRNELNTEKALALPASLRAMGCETVILTGGEPLIRRDWFQIASTCTSVGMNVEVVTNGLLVDGQTIGQLKDAGVHTLCVSLDGNEETHNQIRIGPEGKKKSVYQAALNAVRLCREASLGVHVVTQINRKNLAELPQMFDLLADMDVNVWQLQLCMPMGRLMDHTDDYLISPQDLPVLIQTISDLIKRNTMTVAVADNIGYYSPEEPLVRGSLRRKNAFWTGCQAGCRSAAICSDGLVKGCPSHPRDFAVGNLYEESFETIWQDAARFSYNTQWREADLVGECAKCVFRTICRAGCTSMAYAVTGTIYDNPFCYQRVADAKKSTRTHCRKSA
jgi:radical SAM protein with 4Fe4S-binding SPASM domain